MDYNTSKRLKSASGAPISAPRAAGAIPMYQPPSPMARGSPPSQPSTAVLSRSAATSGKQSLKLTVKAAPSKLRQATSGSSIPPNPYAADGPSESEVTPAPAAARPARSTRNPRALIEPESEEDEDMGGMEAEDGEDDAEADGDVDIEDADPANADSDDDAEGEEDDDDAPEMQHPHPPPPVIKTHPPGHGQRNPVVTVSGPSKSKPLPSVERKQARDEEEDLSDLDSADETADITAQNEDEIGIDIDPEDELLDDDEDGEENDESGSPDSSNSNSRSATPDLTKLTRRQRGAFEEDANLMALSNEALKKKVLTTEEHAMRRQEMARRRKNLSEKKNEEEKMETINKLLQKPAPKRRTRAEMLAAGLHGTGTPGGWDEDGEEIRADPLFARWVSSKEGVRVGVPSEWLAGERGEVFGGPVKTDEGLTRGGARMVEEVA
nr:hypothetical protein B0A51_14438 [Rachicladosporium sp. CCFEE 5018]